MPSLHRALYTLMQETRQSLLMQGVIWGDAAQVLFATETFSTGLNMPAKTVVFTNARKFDGGGFRWLTSGEYIQMSGRAGRRGLDDRGVHARHSLLRCFPTPTITLLGL